jgi:sugar-specific transcriptional regulator TrmB
MKIEEIVETLKKFSLSDYESRVYTTLVLNGPLKAGDVSAESKVPQSKVYSVLEQLMSKEMVEFLGGRPKEFKAVPPNTALKNLLEEREKEIELLKSKINDLSTMLRPLKTREEVLEGIWTIKGKKYQEVFDKISEMIDRSQKYVYGITRDYSRTNRFVDAIKASIKRGVEVKVIGMEKLDGINYYKAKWYDTVGADLRLFEQKIHPRIVVVDGKEVFLRLDQTPERKERYRFDAIWSADPSLVKVMDAYIKNLWKISKPIDFSKIKAPELPEKEDVIVE